MAGDDAFVFVGTYTEAIRFGTGRILEGRGEGIYVYRLDGSSGALALVGTAAATNPSYLAFDAAGRALYAVNELKTYAGQPGGTISAFAVDGETGALHFLNRVPTLGADPCHVSVAARRTHVFVANFMSGSVCVLRVRNDGSLGDVSDFIQHQGASVDPIRQAGPHAHAAVLDHDARFVFVPDLGLDRVMVYRFDAEHGTLRPGDVPWIATKPGAGPRHLAFHPGAAFAYLINELDSTLVALSYDRRSGALAALGAVPTLPGDFRGTSTCADVQIAPSGAFVYGSNRGDDSIVIHRVNPARGTLTYVGHAPTGGRTPRSFAIAPSGRFLLAANQDTDTIVTFRLDPDAGTLTPTPYVARVPTPVCVKFAPDRRREPDSPP
jgi:6-phosphogluconolactonase